MRYLIEKKYTGQNIKLKLKLNVGLFHPPEITRKKRFRSHLLFSKRSCGRLTGIGSVSFSKMGKNKEYKNEMIGKCVESVCSNPQAIITTIKTCQQTIAKQLGTIINTFCLCHQTWYVVCLNPILAENLIHLYKLGSQHKNPNIFFFIFFIKPNKALH